MEQTVPRAGRTRSGGRLIAALGTGAAVAVALGVYGRVHDPTGQSLVTLFFTKSINAKVWLATVALTLALFQVGSAMKFEGRLGAGRGPKWLPRAHRASGTLAFLFAIPVAYHCLWALGYQTGSGTRVLVHGALGCVFFGALAAKVLIVRSKRLPEWAIPVAGGLVFTALVGVWLTSAFWFFTNVEFPGI